MGQGLKIIIVLLIPAILLWLLAAWLFVDLSTPIQFAPPKTYGRQN